MSTRFNNSIRDFPIVFLLAFLICAISSNAKGQTITYKDLIGTWKLVYRDNQIESLEFKDSVNVVDRSLDEDYKPISRRLRYSVVSNKILMQNIGSKKRYSYKIKSFSKYEMQVLIEGSEIYAKTKKIWVATDDKVIRNVTLKRQK